MVILSCQPSTEHVLKLENSDNDSAKHRERFSLTNHRFDSRVLTSRNKRKEVEPAVKDADPKVAGPDGEALPTHVIDDFFKLNPAGVSTWQDSSQWGAHLYWWHNHKTHCSNSDCGYCIRMLRDGHEISPPYKASTLPISPASSSFTNRSSTEPRSSEECYLSTSVWPLTLRHRREKGKEPASDQTYYGPIHESLVTAQMQASHQPFIVPQTCASEAKLIRCSISAKPIDFSQIPAPTNLTLLNNPTPLNLSDSSRLTSRPFEESLLRGNRLPFPLARNSQPPRAPGVKPAQCHMPVAESLRLENPSRISTDAPFWDPELNKKRNSNATRVVRGGFRESIILVKTPNTTAQEAMDVLLSQYRHEQPVAKLQKRRPRQRSPNPILGLLLRPPSSRNNSGSDQGGVAGVPDVTFGATGSLPARPVGPRRRTTGAIGPTGRDAQVCTLPDTRGSLLPQCPVYVDAKEREDRKNQEVRKKQGRGMRIWQYLTDSVVED